ncbi:MAG: LysE family transporter, partial [Chloroflexi bacterium]|nr:LysE family transporter [Chloroflexota bacterium]
MMLSTLLTGAVIAISFSAPPGPVTVETIRRGVRGGFRAALMVQLGSIVGDVTWCAAALIGLAPLAAIPWVRLPLGAIGVVVLVRLGAAGVREALWPSDQNPAVSGMGGFSEAGAFRSGMAISLANPMAVGYWISIGGVMLAAGVAGMSAGQTAAFVAGFV